MIACSSGEYILVMCSSVSQHIYYVIYFRITNITNMRIVYNRCVCNVVPWTINKNALPIMDLQGENVSVI